MDSNNVNEESNSKNIPNEDERQKKWRKEIQENAALQEYFKGFTTYSVDSFIEHLLTYKNLWVQYGPLYESSMGTEGLEWLNDATRQLSIIQQKKLFNTQCLWRANKIKIEGIDISLEFNLWSGNILNCPFIEPISQEDVELYTEFLLQGDVKTDIDMLENWQDYEELKTAYETNNADRDYPDWYEFYDERKGTSVLLTLPDIRGEKENFYLSLFRKAQEEKNKLNSPKTAATAPPLQNIRYYEEGYMEWFVNTYESKEIQKLFKAFEWKQRNKYKKEDLEYDLETLFNANEPVPVEYNENWMEGIRIAANKYSLKKTAEALPAAWEQYMINIQTGIAFPKERRVIFNSYDEIKKGHIEAIIKGRELNGEPADMNF